MHFYFLCFFHHCFRMKKKNSKEKTLPKKYKVAIIDPNLVILEKLPPFKMHSKLPVSVVEFTGIVECIYIIFLVLEFNIKFFLEITDNSDFFPLWRMKLLLDVLFTQKPGR